MHGSRRKKCLKAQRFAPHVARLPHATGAHGLRYRAFTPCSCGRAVPKLGRFLTDASQVQRRITGCSWSQDQDVRGTWGPVGRKRTSAAKSKWETHAKARLSVAG